MRIRVVRLRELDGKGTVKVLADVDLDDGAIQILGVGLAGNPDDPWLSVPAKAGKNGRWWPTVDLSPSLKARVLEKVIAEYAATRSKPASQSASK